MAGVTGHSRVALFACMMALGTAALRRRRPPLPHRATGAESMWLAHELVPTTLTGQDATARYATWTAHRLRVDALTNRARDAAVSAPKDRTTDLNQLLNAVHELTSAMDLHVMANAQRP